MAVINKLDNSASITYGGNTITSNTATTLLLLAPTIGCSQRCRRLVPTVRLQAVRAEERFPVTACRALWRPQSASLPGDTV